MSNEFVSVGVTGGGIGVIAPSEPRWELVVEGIALLKKRMKNNVQWERRNTKRG